MSADNGNTDRTNVSSLKVGDYISYTEYYEVTGVNDTSVHLKNERDFPIIADKKVVSEGMYTASQFNEEKKVSRSELASILENARDTIFTVNFNKQVSQASMAEKLEGADLSSAVARKRLAKELLRGPERTLTGYLVASEPRLGRSNVVDRTLPSGEHNQRLVDHRTINWMVYKNVKYVAK